MTISTNTDRLADEQAIRRIKGTYCDVIDRIIRDKQPDDEGKLRALFTEDAVIDFTQLGAGVIEGREAIVGLFLQGMPSNTGWMWHTIGAEVIDVDGDTASGRWTLLAMAQRVGAPDEPPSLTYGRYIDEFRRVDGEWRQSKVFFLNETKPAA